ncbi:MAG: dimethylsulfonioproprionate lyase family protein [Gammaproteobacteria bacterium]
MSDAPDYRVGKTVRRPAPLARLLEALAVAIRTRSATGAEPRALSDRIFAALNTAVGNTAREEPQSLATCRYLDTVLAGARQGPPSVAALAEAFQALSPVVSWHRRTGAAAQDAAFYDGHANTMIVGPMGMEQRSDVLVGASLLAPGVHYPFHSHPPEEIYVALTEGEWYSRQAGWYAPGVGGIVHHASGVTHAMRSVSVPFLAIWCLWVG